MAVQGWGEGSNWQDNAKIWKGRVDGWSLRVGGGEGRRSDL